MRNDKILAYKMRMKGKSYSEIAEGLGMAKSTLSGWFRHLVIPQEAQDKIRARSRAASLQALLKVNKQAVHTAEQRAITARSKARQSFEALSKQQLKIVGITLYWSDGYKRPILKNNRARTYHPLSFTSSDPAKAKLFVRFLREVCGVTEDKIQADLRMASHQNDGQLLEFWRTATKLPFSSFRKTYHTSYSQPYGVIQLRVNDTALFHTVMGWIEGLGNL